MSEENTNTEKIEVPAKFKKIVEEIESMSVLDLNELVKVFEKKFGVSATAVAAAPAAGAGSARGSARRRARRSRACAGRRGRRRP